jgi:NAD(P)-dependent dehydrogenase (short-subunit alcohol dehydrogenase family)
MKQKDHILVIGGNGGIGYEISKYLLSDGIEVITTYCNSGPNKEYKGPQEFLDLASFDSIFHFVDELQKYKIKNLKGIVFASTSYRSVASYSNQILDDIVLDYNVNLVGPHVMLQRIINCMIKDNYLNVVFLLGGGQGPKRGLSTYIASKWALIGLIESLSEELLSSKINVLGLYPGPFRTKFLSRLIELGDDVIGGELTDHVKYNYETFKTISEDLLLSIEKLLGLDFSFSGKIISARYDCIYEKNREQLLSGKYIFERRGAN